MGYSILVKVQKTFIVQHSEVIQEGQQEWTVILQHRVTWILILTALQGKMPELHNTQTNIASFTLANV